MLLFPYLKKLRISIRLFSFPCKVLAAGETLTLTLLNRWHVMSVLNLYPSSLNKLFWKVPGTDLLLTLINIGLQGEILFSFYDSNSNSVGTGACLIFKFCIMGLAISSHLTFFQKVYFMYLTLVQSPSAIGRAFIFSAH